MGKLTGFLEVPRRDKSLSSIEERIKHYEEFTLPLSESELNTQSSRCMDCGVPFCHNGCPIKNVIPDFNDLVYKARWKEALDVLHTTNNFPEITGRVCPAPCETACTLDLIDEPVTVRTIESAIIDRGWSEGWVVPYIPTHHTGKQIAIIGSGPAGLTCAQQLARAGHTVVVFEKNTQIGGLLRYGIPNFKLDKRVINRRVAQLKAEGVQFLPNIHVGVTVPVKTLLDRYDAVVLAGGAEQSRDLVVPGRNLSGIHLAMDFLSQQNQVLFGHLNAADHDIRADCKCVVVIGGGDTGSDCVGTAIRQSATSVTQIEIMPQPPEKENKEQTWPNWPVKLRTSSSHEEGCHREWGVTTKAFLGDTNGFVRAVSCARVVWKNKVVHEIPGTEFVLSADLVLLAMGFVHPTHKGMLVDLGVALDKSGNVSTAVMSYQTSIPKVFTAGDMHRGQSLVVWAIHEGRQCAHAVDLFLKG